MKQQMPVGGVVAALSTPLFLGVAPIFGKLAIDSGADSFTVAALRTMIAVALLWLIYLLFFRKYIFIYPAGLLGCVVIGVVNGIGSLFYYGGLVVLDASLVQLINGMYLVFAVLLSRMGGQKPDRRTLLRVILALIALLLVTRISGGDGTEWIGIGLMLGSALTFAGTVIFSQYVLYEMPSQTLTLYYLTTMGLLVTMVWLVVGQPIAAEDFAPTMTWIAILGVTTMLSRLAMFAGVKFLGGMQTAVIAVAEIGVALLLANIFLEDVLTPIQWAGVALLGFTLLLIRQRDLLPRGINPNQLVVANMASVQFQRIAFHRAFGTHELDDESGTMTTLTTQEIIAIGQMMGAERGAVNPFPISTNQLLEEITPSGWADVRRASSRRPPPDSDPA